MTPWMWFKLIHVFAGVFWLGGSLFAAMYLLAAARALGPAAGPVLKYVINVRKLPVALNAAAGLTTLSGLAMYDRLSGHFQHLLITNFYGWMLTLGALFGIIALLWGALVPARAAKQLGALTGKLTGPPTPAQAAEIAALQKRLHEGGTIGVVLMALALVGMALSHPI